MTSRTGTPAAVLALALLTLGVAPHARADDDLVIAHQGRLLDAAGEAVSGSKELTFRIYSSRDGGTGSLVWSESYLVNFASGGTYAVMLGDTRDDKAALTADDLNGPRWLAVLVDEVELLPRLQFGTVSRSLNADALGGVAASEYALKSDLSTDAETLGGKAADSYALKADLSTDADTLGGKAADLYALKSELSTDAASLGGKAANLYALKTDTAPDSAKLGGFAATEYLRAGGGGTGNLSLSGLATFGGLALNAQPTVPACNASIAGQMVFDPATRDFLGCDGTQWHSMLGKLVGRTPAQPGHSCKDIKTKVPWSPDGFYFIDPDGAGTEFVATKVLCNMSRDGGGWTLLLKNWYQSELWNNNKAFGSVEDVLERKGSAYKLADTFTRKRIGPNRHFDIMGDAIGYNSRWASGNHEYVILRNYTGDFFYDQLVNDSTTPLTLESRRAADNALAWSGGIKCGVPGGVNSGGKGINCYNLTDGTTNPRGGSGCTINMGKGSDSGWHHFFMGEHNSDTYIYVCNGAQHTSSYDLSHRFWIRER